MEINSIDDRDQKRKKRNLELLGNHANSRAFKVLFDYLDIEIENCRDGLENNATIEAIKTFQGAITAYRALKNTITSAKEITIALNADTPE